MSARTLIRSIVKQIVKETLLVEETLYASNGTKWIGDRQRIVKALVKLGTSHIERQMILSGQLKMSDSTLAYLKRAQIIKSAEPPKPVKPYDWGRDDRRDQRMRSAQEKAYRKAVKEFAAQFTNFAEESPDITPEDAASDLADSFFHEYHKEWRDWARVLQMSRTEMKEAITDYVYEAMKGSG